MADEQFGKFVEVIKKLYVNIPFLDAIQEEIRIQEEAKQIKLHNPRNAKRRIQRKKFLESQKVKVEMPPTPKKVWRKKVSSPKTPSGDDNQTKEMESPAPDSKPEPSP